VRRRFGHRCPPVLRPTRSPLHRHAPWRPLPARRRAFGPGSTRPWIPFRHRGFAPPRRFSPPSAPKRMDLAVRESRACCIPLPIVGFIAFRGSPAVASRMVRSSRRLHPSKDSPRAQPVRVSTACCPLAVGRVALLAPPGFALPLPPFCAPPASKLDFKALLCGESVPRRAVSDATWAYPPLGFCVPFKILTLARPGRMPLSHDGRPDRFRGAVSVPTTPAPTGVAAAPRSNGPVRAVGRSRRSGVPLVAAIPRGLELTHAATPQAWGVTCIAGEPHHH